MPIIFASIHFQKGSKAEISDFKEPLLPLCLTLSRQVLMTFLRQIFLRGFFNAQSHSFFLIGWVTNGPSHDPTKKSPHFYVDPRRQYTTTVHIRSHTNHEHNDEQWAFAANSQLLFKNINNKEGNLDQGIPKMLQLFFLRKRLNSGNPLFIVCFSLFLGAILD